MRFLAALLLLALASPVLAQQRQPAQITTLPTANPQEFDLLDATGKWMPFGTASGGIFSLKGSAAIDPRDYGAKCDGTTDDSAALNAAATAARAANKALRIPNAVCYSSVALNFGSLALIGATPHIPTNPLNSSTISCAASIAASCVTVGTPQTPVGQGATVRDLVFAFIGTPVAGDAALSIKGFGSVLDNIFVYNAWDGYLFFQGISAHANLLHSGRIYNNHVVQNGSPEIYISNARFGMNGLAGPGDVDNSNAFFGITGSNPNTLTCVGCQLNLGSKAPKYVYDFYSVASQSDGIYTLSDSTIDMSLGTGVAIIHSDGTGSCYRCIWNSVSINAPALPFFALGSATSMNQAAFTDSNFFVSSFTLPSIQILGLRLANLYISGSVTIDGASGSHASVSGVFSAGAMVIQGGSWSGLNLSGLVAGSYTDAAATGNVRASGTPAITWTPQLQFGGANVAMTQATTYGRSSRQSDGSVKQIFGVGLSALGSSTGNATIAGAPYTCNGFGLGQIDMGPVYAINMTGLTAPLFAVGGTSSTVIGVKSTGAVGLTNATQANFTNTSNIAGTSICNPL